MPSGVIREPASRARMLACMLLAGCAHGVVRPAARSTPGRLTVVMDFAAVESWLACRKAGGDLSRCAAASATTAGGQIGQLAHDTFGSGHPPAVAQPKTVAVARLVEQMKAWPDVSARVLRFFPKPVSGTIRVFVVANGHPWGDAYVRTVSGEGATFRLAPDGDPVAVLNAVLIAGSYRGTPAEQASSALGVLRHEAFHVAFNWYRRSEPAWARLAQPAPTQQLAVLVLNEGIAHFVDREDELLSRGFDEARGVAALRRLAEASRRLERAGSEESTAILSSASQGKYWDKFGSVSGMLFAYGVFRAFGIDGLRRAIRCGPGSFAALYDEATRKHSVLPRIPAELLAAWLPLNICQQARTQPQPAPSDLERARARFTEHRVQGVVVVLVPTSKDNPGSSPRRLVVEHGDRATTRMIPASTFKIVNTLIGLETGAVTPKETFRWDGKPRFFKAWEQDLSLQQAFRVSCVPCYQEVARRVGLQRMQRWVRQLGYGNASIGAHVDLFWLRGPLQISVDEQAALIRRVFLGEVPFSPANVGFLKQTMMIEEAPSYRLYAKTGCATRPDPNVGWYVGWVETQAGPRFFATRVLVPADRPKVMAAVRKELTMEVLRDLHVIP